MRLALVAAVLCLVGSSCMLSPVDGQVVSSTTTSIPFEGYTTTASQTVRLDYAVGSTWRDGGTTTTSATVTRVEDDVELYGWSLPTPLPAAAWTAGTTGSFARVRMAMPSTTGSETYLYSFTSNWSSCYADHPGLSNFVSNCKSPNSPVAYLFTSNYPAGVDLTVTLFWTSQGRTEVRVRNAGRQGKVTRVECSKLGSASALSIDEYIAPGESRSYYNAVAPSGTVTCTAFGTNADGSPEANTSNNSATRTF